MKQLNLFFDESKIETAREILALDGYFGQIRQKYGQEELDRIIESETERIAMFLPDIKHESETGSRIVNDVENYGIIKEDLRCFRSKAKGNYEALEDIFYGIHNIDVPHEQLQRMNSAEILALYLGTGELKRNMEIDGTKYIDIINKPIEEIVSKLVNFGFKYNGIRTMQKRGFVKHDTSRGALKKRMKELPFEVKDEFLSSLKKPYRKSNIDDKIKFEFYDSNVEGHKDYTTKRIYISNIDRIMGNIHHRNLKKNERNE